MRYFQKTFLPLFFLGLYQSVAFPVGPVIQQYKISQFIGRSEIKDEFSFSEQIEKTEASEQSKFGEYLALKCLTMYNLSQEKGKSVQRLVSAVSDKTMPLVEKYLAEENQSMKIWVSKGSNYVSGISAEDFDQSEAKKIGTVIRGCQVTDSITTKTTRVVYYLFKDNEKTSIVFEIEA